MHSLPRRVALLAALTMVGVLPTATADATVAPPTVEGKKLTVVSDQGADTITLTAAGGVLVVNGTPTTLAANAEAEIVVNAGAGADVVDATALAATNYGTLRFSGGEGDDSLTGGAGTDALIGDAGNDRLVGFKGEDDAEGGAGDDVMVWNNGDNTDVNFGGEGFDEVEVNGSPLAGDSFTYRPHPELPGWVLFKRDNLVKFEIELQAERLTINGLGGNDLALPDPAAPEGLAALTSLTVNGGTGEDELAGGDGGDRVSGGAGGDSLSGGGGADLISGGDDVDVVRGQGGDDRLVGDRGADLLEGGEGDDVPVWNNGDGSDTAIGGTGTDHLEVNGSAAAGDTFQLEPVHGDAVFRRTNLVPFEVVLSDLETLLASEPNGGIEFVTVDGGGGNDSLTVLPGLPDLPVVASGGAGDDVLTGAEEADSFVGGSGGDMLLGGPGADLLDGQEGEDKILARDGSGDLVHGGLGSDKAQTDAVTVDQVDGVEELDATPAPEAPAPGDTRALVPAVGKVAVVRMGRGFVARVPLSCPAAEAGGCRASVTLETAKAVKLGALRAVLVLGSKRLTLDAGQRATAAVRLPAGAAALARHGRLPVRVRVASSDAAGNSAARSLLQGLRFPRG